MRGVLLGVFPTVVAMRQNAKQYAKTAAGASCGVRLLFVLINFDKVLGHFVVEV